MLDMEGDEYESLPTTTSVKTHMMAGALAGIMEHSVMYPVDCVKTRMQILEPHPKARYKSITHALENIIRREGIRQTMRGMQAVIGGAGPAHAMYFACYERLKKAFSSSNYGHHVIAHGAAGCVATLLHDAVMNPAEVIKQRLQMYKSPYAGSLDCIRSVLRTEGLRAFYRSYTTQLTMNVPFQSIHFVMYELMQDFLNSQRNYHPGSHVISGALAGAIAAAVTTPLDVCKTLLNTQTVSVASSSVRIDGMVNAIRTVYNIRGFTGYFQGVSARVVFQMPATAISWSVYEFFKYFITKQQHQQNDSTATSVVHENEFGKVNALSSSTHYLPSIATGAVPSVQACETAKP
ncbi:mitoferrin-1-like [Tubulanus polymorphus]|uniref:mitoferrin-1-like n=1 Tax=Tubulanus polymorphus TaxID=672921 RepID=UPI003DA1DD97